MKVIVFGLGRVGTVAVAALLRGGHVVVGIDKEQAIRDRIAAGQSPFREPDVADLLDAGGRGGRLSVGAAVGDHVDADIVLVCVGTHGTADGALDLSDVIVAARTLGEAIRGSSRRAPADPAGVSEHHAAGVDDRHRAARRRGSGRRTARRALRDRLPSDIHPRRQRRRRFLRSEPAGDRRAHAGMRQAAARPPRQHRCGGVRRPRSRQPSW